MLITPSDTQVILDRQQALLATVIRDRQITAAIQPSPGAAQQPAGHTRAGLRQAVAALAAALVALASIC